MMMTEGLLLKKGLFFFHDGCGDGFRRDYGERLGWEGRKGELVAGFQDDRFGMGAVACAGMNDETWVEWTGW